MRLSYAQRLEDYHLDLVFPDQKAGFYIDIGAGHPIADNVSYWFYLKGWCGLIAEPQQRLAALYAHLRPRDIAICSLIGRMEGEADFHLVDRLHGLSTTRASHAEAAVRLGASFCTLKAQVRTLAALCAEHNIAHVDFLKIDVEGAEADVIAGNDWEKLRPRILVIEAFAPGSGPDDWKAWEPVLLANCYRFAFFDGLNRFYVAEECAELAARFPTEPAAENCVAHLSDFGSALERPDHFDHALACRLVKGFLATLPSLERGQLARLLCSEPDGSSLSIRSPAETAALLFGTAEYPGAAPDLPAGSDHAQLIRAVMDTDRFRAALGRIAASYDGGHLQEHAAPSPRSEAEEKD